MTLEIENIECHCTRKLLYVFVHLRFLRCPLLHKALLWEHIKRIYLLFQQMHIECTNLILKNAIDAITFLSHILVDFNINQKQ